MPLFTIFPPAGGGDIACCVIATLVAGIIGFCMLGSASGKLSKPNKNPNRNRARGGLAVLIIGVPVGIFLGNVAIILLYVLIGLCVLWLAGKALYFGTRTAFAKE